MAQKSTLRRRLDRWVLHPLQSIPLGAFYLLFRVLPVDAASNLGGFLGRTLGLLMSSANQRAHSHLSMVLPELPEQERRRIIRGMWDNIGRTLAEYPHLLRLLKDGDRIEVVGAEHAIDDTDTPQARIMIGAHIGNWELPGSWLAHHLGKLTTIYRAPNNRLADWLIRRIRKGTGMVLYQKGEEGTRAAMRALSKGESLGMLLDQKLNRGVAVPFFGRDAMTTPALAVFALRYNCAVVPARVERLGGARFRLTFYPPLRFESTDNRHADVKAIMSTVNEIYESWIRERPEQWFWMHRRWIESKA